MKRSWPLTQRDYAGIPARRKAFRELLATRCRATQANTHELVFGELVTNAVRYGAEPMSVAVVISGGFVRIEVDHAGACFQLEDELAKEPTTSGGRGLHIVHCLVDRLTVESSPTTPCRVTATLSL